jgi:hypothetical protein
MTATARLLAEIARRDVEIEATEIRQRLVILSAERRGLVLALDVIEAEHVADAAKAARDRPVKPTGYMGASLRLCAALRERDSA